MQSAQYLHKIFLFMCCFLCIGFFLFGQPVETKAQVGSLEVEEALQLTPSFPEPNQSVTVVFAAYSKNTEGAEIYWFVDGEEDITARNSREITLSTGDIGSTQTVQVVVALPSGAALTFDRTITPSLIDIIIEADTVVPSFYKGKKHWSSGAKARAIAIPYFGNTTDVRSYAYKWTLDSTVLGGGSITGRNAIDLTMPTFTNSILTVTVLDQEGLTIAEKSILLRPTKPKIHFYPVSPLHGQSFTAIRDEYVLTGNQIALRAEPYFVDKGLTSSNAAIEWKIDGTTRTNESDDPFLITLTKQGEGGGASDVRFRIVNLQDFLQHAESSFRLFFE